MERASDGSDGNAHMSRWFVILCPDTALTLTDEREEVRVVDGTVVLVVKPMVVEKNARDHDAEEGAEHVDPYGATDVRHLHDVQEQVLREDGDGRLEKSHEQVLNGAELADESAEADEDDRHREVGADEPKSIAIIGYHLNRLC